jgi:hypothetical protein
MKNSTRYLAVPAVALAMALGSGAVARALPEWDIGAYDKCVAGIPTILGPTEYHQSVYECCTKTGGIFDFDNMECVAPPAESQGGRRPLTEAPTHVMTPSQPEQVPGGQVLSGAQ